MSTEPATIEEWRPVPSHPHYEVSNLYRWRRKYTAREGFTPPRTSTPVPLYDGVSSSPAALRALVHRVFGVPAVVAADKPPKPPPKKPASKIDPYVDMLGTVPDADIAERAGVSRQFVQQVRLRLGIPAAVTPPIAIAAGADRRAELAWLAGERLGSETDVALAAEFGVCPATVRQVRVERGVPAAPRPRPGSRLDAYRDLMGVIPDVRIAERAAVAPAMVCMYRKRHGIQPCPETAKHSRSKGA